MPFTAGSAPGSQGELINHFTGIKLRATGSCNLIPTFASLDTVATQRLVSIVVTPAPGRQLFRLGNFITERAFLRLETAVIDETFNINRIIIYAKPLWTEYPA